MYNKLKYLIRTIRKGAQDEKGFGVVETLLVIVIIGLLGVVGWQFFSRQKATKNNASTATNSEQVKKTEESKNTEESTEEAEEPKNTQEPTEEVAKTTIYPENSTGDLSKDSYTTTLPSGWSVQKVYQQYNIVKTIGNDKYLISSSIEYSNSYRNRNLMKQRVAEGFEAITSVKTSSGTDVSVLKTPTVLFLASCKPTSENCYLRLNGKELYIHLYKIIPGAQSAPATTYPQEIINDFESIAKSLSI